jgi:hypothetical protein
MSDKPETFDWVLALSACSVGDVFERLRSQVKSDVEAREAMRQQAGPREQHYAFRFMSQGGEFFAVVEGHKIHRAVIFVLSVPSRSIMVRDDHDVLICSATTTINDDGECRLKVKGQERELWQFRKEALEGLLFGAY